MRGWRVSARAATMRSSRGARPRVSLSGLPGVTSHHTRSRSSLFIAIRDAARWASWGGSKVPPNRPMRMPRPCAGRRKSPLCARRPAVLQGPEDSFTGYPRRGGVRDAGSRPDLSRPVHAVFEGGELIDPYRPARVEAACGDPDLGPEPELAAIGKLRRSVVQHDCGIDLAQEFFGVGRVLGDDGVGVM